MIKVSEIVSKLKVTPFIQNYFDGEIEKISVDSRDVDDKTLFVAIKGFNFDAHSVLSDVINKGAAAVVIEKDNLPDGIYSHSNTIKIVVPDTREALAVVSDLFYGSPSSKMNLYGITGTKGKSTSAFFMKSILEAAGRKSGLIGTIKNVIGDRDIPTKLTTPESYTINNLLSEMLTEGISDCVMEVSSHALSLKRVYGLDFDVAAFTNLASDHLDFYGTRENYFRAKKILFDSLKPSGVAVINADDDFSEQIVSDCKGKIVRFGLSENADYRIKKIDFDFSGTRFTVEKSGKEIFLETALIGDFNAYNALLAFVMAVESGISIEDAVKGISSMPQVPGRFEVIKSNGKTVVIDYAHTAGSLEAVLKATRKIAGNKMKILIVFGAGGDRDKTKRPEMGKAAEKYSDKIFVTSDNPRTESPNEIIEDVVAGLVNKNVYVNPDREEAIKSAISEADENSVIIIAGKGHEDYQEINGVRNHFSDKEIAEKYLNL